MNSEDHAQIVRTLADEDATERLAEEIACISLPGDQILLRGELGSGKTSFARAFLRTLAGDPALEVPSPSYTIVQSYALGAVAASHLDLYRVGDESELDELGLDELRSGILLVEWPERAPAAFSGDRLEIGLELDPHAPEARCATLVAQGPGWVRRLDRLEAIRNVLTREGLDDGHRRPVAGDASTRRYERLRLPGRTLIVMDAPAQPDPGLPGTVPYSRQVHLAESVAPFAAIAEALTSRGFSAPVVHAADLDAGILVLEDLGSEAVLDAVGAPVAERYLAAAELLAELHQVDWPRRLSGIAEHELPPYDMGALLAETMLTPQWFAPAALGRELPDEAVADFEAAWRTVLQPYAEGRRETSLTLRDFHSPNIVWLPDREGTRRVGLLDFQDALVGPAAYDLAAIAMDARVDVSPALFEEIVRRYLEARDALGSPVAEETLRADVAVMAAQRLTKVLGIFVRLARRDGKTRYLRHLPRLDSYLERALAEPLLEPVKEWYERHLPAPVRRAAAAERPA